ncbi:sensor histidine kinase [Rhizobium terrae]|uniref:sensor histidine kinase n=1 Tax=Rhizobium terrae TaxID=2171756 RepID=UPI000E3C5B57|nr:HWE histidine kinase domain-containing protein [Rhizobium terrae]
MPKDLFEELADNAPVMIWRAGLDKACDFFNRPWLEFTGRTEEEELGSGWAEGVHPDDYDRCLQIYISSFDARLEFSMEYRLRRHDGVYRWILDNGKPFYRNGAFAGYFGSCIDIHDRKTLEETQTLLVAELNHRVKNMLATIQALARQSLSGGGSAKEAERRLSARLMALSKVHELLAGEGWQGAGFSELVREVTSFSVPRSERIEIGGPDIRLKPARAQTLALVLKELSLNALEFGAWSNAAGKVSIHWQIAEKEGQRFLDLEWRESGGPPVEEPARRGFGSRLILNLLPHEAAGSSELRFAPGGVTAWISLPV